MQKWNSSFVVVLLGVKGLCGYAQYLLRQRRRELEAELAVTVMHLGYVGTRFFW